MGALLCRWPEGKSSKIGCFSGCDWLSLHRLYHVQRYTRTKDPNKTVFLRSLRASLGELLASNVKTLMNTAVQQTQLWEIFDFGRRAGYSNTLTQSESHSGGTSTAVEVYTTVTLLSTLMSHQ